MLGMRNVKECLRPIMSFERPVSYGAILLQHHIFIISSSITPPPAEQDAHFNTWLKYQKQARDKSIDVITRTTAVPYSQ